MVLLDDVYRASFTTSRHTDGYDTCHRAIGGCDEFTVMRRAMGGLLALDPIVAVDKGAKIGRQGEKHWKKKEAKAAFDKVMQIVTMEQGEDEEEGTLRGLGELVGAEFWDRDELGKRMKEELVRLCNKEKGDGEAQRTSRIHALLRWDWDEMKEKLGSVQTTLLLRLEHEIMKHWSSKGVDFYASHEDHTAPSLKQLRLQLRNVYDETVVVKLFLTALKKIRRLCARASSRARALSPVCSDCLLCCRSSNSQGRKYRSFSSWGRLR